MKKKSTITSTQSYYMFCDGIDCPNDIGFKTKFGKKYYDEGVYNIGFHYFCPKCAKKGKFK